MSRAPGKPLPPAKNPCGSCPYRRDVPSGVWHESEYARLATYDGETFTQPASLFACHQSDQRLCAGWVGCHDMDQSLSVRIAGATGQLAPQVIEDLFDYTTPVPLFASGAEAAEHGLVDVESPNEKARRVIAKLAAKAQRAG